MKKWITWIAIFSCLNLTPQAVLAVVSTPEQSTLTRQEQKKQERLEKRLDRMEQKIQKRAARQKARSSAYDLWDDGNFRLGALMVLAGLGLGLVAALGIFSGLFNFMAGIFLLAGLILIVIALVDYN